MVHMLYASLIFNIYVAYIDMRHQYTVISGVALVAHPICATHMSKWCATNKLFSTSDYKDLIGGNINRVEPEQRQL
jgi:hypothetical protein